MNLFQAISQAASRSGSASRDLNAVYRAVEKGDPSIIAKRVVRKQLFKTLGGAINRLTR